MKKEINIQHLVQMLGLDYPELLQISDDADGYIRLIGYVSDLPTYREKRWFVTAEIITINPATNKVLTIEPAKVKNQDWVITNNYYAVVTENHISVSNPDFDSEHEITLENSPYQLSPAFDFYFGIRHSRTTQLKMSDLFQAAVESHDKWGYFDKKESHIELIDVIKIIYQASLKS